MTPEAKALGDQPAFPQPLTDNQGRMDMPNQYGVGGLTKREWLTGMAMQGLLQNPSLIDDAKAAALEWISESATRMADHQLEQLAKPQ